MDTGTRIRMEPAQFLQMLDIPALQVIGDLVQSYRKLMETLLFIAIVCVLGALLFSPGDWGKWR